MGEIHELFLLALSLVWFAGATPENTLNLPFFLDFQCVFFPIQFAGIPVDPSKWSETTRRQWK